MPQRGSWENGFLAIGYGKLLVCSKSKHCNDDNRNSGAGTGFGAICRHMLGFEAGVNAKEVCGEIYIRREREDELRLRILMSCGVGCSCEGAQLWWGCWYLGFGFWIHTW
ncbi:hypothetical protein VNO78_15636 [Psophocarpus tetragonolobus]|uniref:Uncharacterized protein n=1 Tax=Psophocarpus tetragonolobus TaxID=3891 RepID=A0AAN9SEF1_PSOTE